MAFNYNEKTITPVDGVDQLEYVIPDDARRRIENTFTYHAPKGDQTRRYHELREKAKELAYMIEAYVPASDERCMARVKLEEAIFFANAGIARNE